MEVLLLDGSNGESDSVSDVSTSLEIAASSPVGLLGGKILLDCSLVEEPVLAKGLNEGAWFLEDLGPLLDCSDIVSEGGRLAWGNIHLKVVDEGLKVLEGRDDVEFLEVADEFLDVWHLLVGT